MKKKVIEILSNAQQSVVNHQKYIGALKNIYNTVDFNEFSHNILTFLQGVIQKDFKNKYVDIVLDFIAKVIGHICEQQNSNIQVCDQESISHPLLTRTIEVILQYHRIDNENCRYNTCSFISALLKHMSRDTRLDNDLCDLIESAMLNNTKDPKPGVRVQAILALVRLQDPLNPDCPVIQAFMLCLKDPSPLVRREAVKRIAPNAITIPKLKDRTRDVNDNVRCAAFMHCGDLGLTQFRIVQRQHILRSGFNEKNRVVKKLFLTYLLPKWLSSVEGEYMTFFNAIRLDSDETDVLNTTKLSKNLMEVFAKNEPVMQLIEALPLNDKNLIPVEKVDCESTFYWDILITHFRKLEDMDEYLEMMIPELTRFCSYIEEVVSTKMSKSMNDSEYMNCESMLYYLLNIADNFDFSDEVGRKALDKLALDLLSKYFLQGPLLTKIIQIRRKLITNMNDFADEIVNVIADKRNPIVEKPCPRERSEELQMAKLKVELLCLKVDLESAVDAKDFQKAAVLQDKITDINRKLEMLNSPGEIEMIRTTVTNNDPKTVCWCLDLLTVTLGFTGFKQLPTSLIDLRDSFVMPLDGHKDPEIQWRYFKCIMTFAMFDRKLAETSLKHVLSNIVSYQIIPNFSKEIVVTSVHAVADFLRVYGSKFFSFNEDNNSVSSQNTIRRRFYDQDGDDVSDVTNQVSIDILLNVILDMLDDETEELRDAAVTAYAKLMLNGFYITPTVMARFILKWYNPATDLILQQKIGTIIGELSERHPDAKKIIAKAIIPLVKVLANAPKTSPLLEIDMDNLLKFLGTISRTRIHNSDFSHRELLHLILNEISVKPADPATPYFAKILQYLMVDVSDPVVVKEVIAQAALLQEKEELDNVSKQHLQKFINLLNSSIVNNTTASSATEVTQEPLSNVETLRPSGTSVFNLKVVLTDVLQYKSGDAVAENDIESQRKRRKISNSVEPNRNLAERPNENECVSNLSNESISNSNEIDSSKENSPKNSKQTDSKNSGDSLGTHKRGRGRPKKLNGETNENNNVQQNSKIKKTGESVAPSRQSSRSPVVNNKKIPSKNALPDNLKQVLNDNDKWKSSRRSPRVPLNSQTVINSTQHNTRLRRNGNISRLSDESSSSNSEKNTKNNPKPKRLAYNGSKNTPSMILSGSQSDSDLSEANNTPNRPNRDSLRRNLLNKNVNTPETDSSSNVPRPKRGRPVNSGDTSESSSSNSCKSHPVSKFSKKNKRNSSLKKREKIARKDTENDESESSASKTSSGSSNVPISQSDSNSSVLIDASPTKKNNIANRLRRNTNDDNLRIQKSTRRRRRDSPDSNDSNSTTSSRPRKAKEKKMSERGEFNAKNNANSITRSSSRSKDFKNGIATGPKINKHKKKKS